MIYIVFDIEATCWKIPLKNMEPETIEIGAVKYNYYGEHLGTFDQFIRPLYNPQLSHFCTDLTSITQKNIDAASKFPSVIEDFRHWIGEEEYTLASWGNFDTQILESDCHNHQMDAEWLYPCFDLKYQYHKITRQRKFRGLFRAVEYEGFEWDGNHHRAIDDAINLSKIFNKYIDEWV